ncbi:LEAF RUST 10 DISEASE-RESISTANCE LOCUS RECEPTOR-LIKE PROTEIN KINASE 2.1 [Trifolium repens]|nr:LEAF RUST 10 DISEASE-RESISTANCE LOCUS RECEPTOR-LIKE PROTEIN KINASE 2.1 [Trifolium repens]
MKKSKSLDTMWWKRVILVLLLLPFTCNSKHKHACPPSSCGKISKISYPFRLQNDPLHCGDSRLVDPGFQQSNCSSLPLKSLSRSDFCDTYNNDNKNCNDAYHARYTEERYLSASGDLNFNEQLLFEHIVYLNCTKKVTKNSKYVHTVPCVKLHFKSKSKSKSKRYYIYAIAGDLIAQDVQAGCEVKLMAPTSLLGNLHRNKGISYHVIHEALVYGFEVSWLHLSCLNHCGDLESCIFNAFTEEIECHPKTCYSYLSFSASTKCGKWSLIASKARDAAILFWRGREVREYTNLTDPKDKKLGKGKDKIDDEDVTFQRMVAKMQEVAGERGGYLHGRGGYHTFPLTFPWTVMIYYISRSKWKQRRMQNASCVALKNELLLLLRYPFVLICTDNIPCFILLHLGPSSTGNANIARLDAFTRVRSLNRDLSVCEF